jgi:hypothetical protein
MTQDAEADGEGRRRSRCLSLRLDRMHTIGVDADAFPTGKAHSWGGDRKSITDAAIRAADQWNKSPGAIDVSREPNVSPDSSLGDPNDIE